MISVFDRVQIKRQRSRCLPFVKDHDFLFDWTMQQIADRLTIVRREFPLCLQIGSRGPSLPSGAFGIEKKFVMDNIRGGDIIAEEDFFPFADNSLDLVVSALNLHTVNDLPGAFLQIKRALKPDGLFIAAILGGETLFELRRCLEEAEIELTGGVSPRVAPFADKPQMGDLLQRGGFSLPVVDSDIVTVTYDSIFPLMRDLRRMGEGNAVIERIKTFTPRSIFLRAGEIYAEKFAEPDGRICASFEIIFLIGWSPHSSQQKPLRRGSAKSSLAEFLGTEEIGAGEKPH
jgi:NADH dehydrogenase [ubiquinone] 1 alpha subcomplex assembly factor 5